jgi:hypothetical protein
MFIKTQVLFGKPNGFAVFFGKLFAIAHKPAAIAIDLSLENLGLVSRYNKHQLSVFEIALQNL